MIITGNHEFNQAFREYRKEQKFGTFRITIHPFIHSSFLHTSAFLGHRAVDAYLQQSIGGVQPGQVASLLERHGDK